MRPYTRTLRHIRQISAITTLRAPRKARNHLQIAHVLARGQAPIRLRIFQMIVAHIVRAPL